MLLLLGSTDVRMDPVTKAVSTAPGCSNDSLNNTTVAVDVFSPGHPLQCNDQVLIVGLGAELAR